MANIQDGGWGWMITLSNFVVNMLTAGLVKNFALFFVVFQENVGGSAAQVSWIGSIMTALPFLTAPLANMGCQILGERTISLIGACLVGAGCLISTLATSISFLCVSMGFLVGMGIGLLVQPAAVMIVKYFQKNLSLASAIGRSGMGMSVAVTPFVQHLIEIYGWKGSLLICGGMTLNLIPSSMLLQPINTKEPDTSTKKEDNPSFAFLDEICITELERLNPLNQECTNTNKLQQVGETELTPVKLDCFERPEKDSLTNLTCWNNKGYLSSNKKQNFKPRILSCKQNYLDFSHLKNPFFYIFSWSFLFSQLSYFIPIFHLVAKAKTLGIGQRDISYIISISGITESACQLLSGWIADQNWIKKYHLHKTYLILCGVTNLLSPFATTLPLLTVYCISFAIFSGGYLALLLPILVELVGASKSHSAWGLARFIAGFGVMTGPPIAGWLYDQTQTYSCSFIFAGTCFFVSSLSLFLEPLAQKWRLKRTNCTEHISKQTSASIRS